MPKKGPKSYKADGTPKRRWSAAERAARGRGPRRRGGQEHDDKPKRAKRGAAPEARRPRRSWDNTEDRRQRKPRHWAEPESRGRQPERAGKRRDGDNRRKFTPDKRGERRFDDAPWEKRSPRKGAPPRGGSHKPRPNRDRPTGDRRRQTSHDQPGREHDYMEWRGENAATQREAAAVASDSGFAALGVHPKLVAELAARGIVEPFPIQAASIVDGIAGRDVLGRGRTGSGKTLAFGLPILTRLSQMRGKGAPRAMILSPTRELAMQIADNLAPLAAAVGVDLTLVAGGMSYGPQIRAFERGVDVVVATPGRLIDLLRQGAADLSQVDVTVLDEADHMSDLGFLPDVKTLLGAVKERGQRLLFSATLDEAVQEVVRLYLTDPVTHEVDPDKASVTTMTHHMLLMKPHLKQEITAQIANRAGKTVIFARTQMGTTRVAEQLRAAGVLAGALHGGLTQGARARILAAFKAGEVPVLVATDVAARGIHVDDVTLVLQVDPPVNSKDYLHRAGRTARAGEAGAVVTVVLPHQRKMMRRITGQAGVAAIPLDVEPGSPELRDVTGSRAPSGTPIAEGDYLKLIAPKQGGSRNRFGKRHRRRHH